MMKQKMQRIEALQQNVKLQKDTLIGGISANYGNTNNQSIKRDSSNISTKKKVNKNNEEDEDSDSSQKNLFTEKYFSPNKNFTNYINDHKHK